MDAPVGFRVRGAVDDVALSALHDLAFGGEAFGEPGPVQPWNHRLHHHSLTWVEAYAAARLVGFVNVAWDGGAHAFLLDTCVDPGHQRAGVGRELVRRAADGRAFGRLHLAARRLRAAPRSVLRAVRLLPHPGGAAPAFLTVGL